YSHSLVQNSVDGSYCQRIIEAENPVWNGFLPQKLAHCFRAMLPALHIYSMLGDDVVIDELKPCFFECLFVAFQTVGCDAIFRPANMGNSFTTHIDEMLGCQLSHCLIIHTNKTCR